jgi:hypothetical protein
MTKLELAKSRLDDVKVLLRYLSFLRNNGFSEIGTGKLLGQAKILSEIISSQTVNADLRMKNEHENLQTKNLESFKAYTPVVGEISTNDDSNELSDALVASAGTSNEIVNLPNQKRDKKNPINELLSRRRLFQLKRVKINKPSWQGKIKMIKFINDWQ